MGDFHRPKRVFRKIDRDKHILEAAVRKFGPVSRVHLHNLTNIRRTTISLLVRQLLQEGRLVEAGRADNRFGRKQILLRLNEEYGNIVAIEFDNEQIIVGLLDLSPRITYQIRKPTNLGAGVSGLIRQLQSGVRKVLQQAEVKTDSLVAIGIADPGYVDSRGGITLTASTIDFWKDVPLKRIFEAEFGIPTVLESKTRAKAVAERMLGAGEKSDNLIYIDYGPGIGAGVVVDGRLLYGQDCGVGEFGHTHVLEGGPVCKCGSLGCLEAIAGPAAIEARMLKALNGGTVSRALVLGDGDAAKITAWAILSAAKSGDKICSNILAELASYLGLGLANLVNLFNPSVIVLNKRLELAGDGLLYQLHQIIRRQALHSSSDRLTLKFGKLGDECGLLGVALIALGNHYEIPALKPPKFLTEPVPPLGSSLNPVHAGT
jgi:predicted NBD/HSP70 family sugar kinase